MKTASPYLYFAGNAEEAFGFYRQVFGGEFLQVLRYRDFGDNAMQVADSELDLIAHIGLPLGDSVHLMGTDVTASMGKNLVVGNNLYITLQPETREEAERVFSGLSAGGRVEMPLQGTEWAELYGSCVDRYGVQWMADYGGTVEGAGYPDMPEG